ncbi:MAG TPA: tail fiber domain-containing protein, partial [Longimicrobium sp.]|uniref:tail fiber domain-containing protein n=1 Tax=Longimicrobium sp. TaxID=2029185 RepID=UPI002ED82A14
KVFGDASTTDSIEAVANNEFAVRAAGGFRFRSNATLTNGCNIAAGGAAITCASSRTLKENFLDVDGDDVLSRMRRIPVNTWNYTDEGRQSRHMGPFAEDFWREFGLGTEPLAIGHLDIDGVNFAGVKALDERTLEMRSTIVQQASALARQGAQIEALRSDNETLRAANAEMEARIARLEALVAPTPAP